MLTGVEYAPRGAQNSALGYSVKDRYKRVRIAVLRAAENPARYVDRGHATLNDGAM